VAILVAILVAIVAAWSNSSAAAPSSKPGAAPFQAMSVYGSVQGDSRNNHEVGGLERARLSYRFRAGTTSAATSIRVQQRGLGGSNTYSGGNGGTIRVSIRTDNGGIPSGTILASVTFAPGNPSGNWEDWNLLTFPTPATLTAGQIYHVVFDNVDPAPTANWISLNDLFYWGGPFAASQPTFSSDFAVLYARPTMWTVLANDTPIFDLAYANGNHDGMGYIGAMGQYYGSISGPSMVREHFTVSNGNRTVSSASVKVKRISGLGQLSIRLETGDGTIVESGVIVATAIPVGNLPASDGDASVLGGNTWATVTFPSPYTLASGSTYNLVLSTTSDTRYVAVPVQEGTDKGLLSYRFTDGDGQRTTDGGSTWANLYLWGDTDLQFYFR
jgi:hypothetical protein